MCTLFTPLLCWGVYRLVPRNTACWLSSILLASVDYGIICYHPYYFKLLSSVVDYDFWTLFESVCVCVLTFMHSHAAVIALDDLIRVLTVVSQTDAADQNVLHVLRGPHLSSLNQRVLWTTCRKIWILDSHILQTRSIRICNLILGYWSFRKMEAGFNAEGKCYNI